MKLYIDTSDREKITLKLDEKEFVAKALNNKSQNLIPLVDKALKEEKKKLEDISEIKVNTGPGSFTGLRVGVTVAMTLGYVLGVPVNGKNIKKEGDVEVEYA